MLQTLQIYSVALCSVVELLLGFVVLFKTFTVNNEQCLIEDRFMKCDVSTMKLKMKEIFILLKNGDVWINKSSLTTNQKYYKVLLCF